MFLLVSTLIKFAILIVGLVLPLAAVLTLMERRQSAFSQDRVGPSRAYFFRIFGRPIVLGGLLHVVADAVKSLFKETTLPQGADRPIFRLAPLVGFTATLAVVSLVPFGPDISTPWGVLPLQIARIDAGILIVLAISSLGIYGVALGGWASNNRFALLGAMRASAQAISYEIALGLTIVGVLITYGSTELSAIANAQSGLLYGFLPNWGIFLQPMGAMLFLTAAMAETKRAPFDIPEGESEIIGYFVEYSSMPFGLFMLNEFIEVVVLSALFVTLFLGGWQFPWLIGTTSVNLGFWVSESPWVMGIAGFVVFAIKVFFMSAVQLQIRWTLPRFRYDQVMRLGWKMLLPLALVNIFVTAVLVWWDPSLGYLAYVSLVFLVLVLLVAIAGPRRRAVPAHGHG